jgi:cytoskeletal protein RodZ
VNGNFEESNGSSRSGKRAKRRKTNIILNTLIGVVLLLIIIVSAAIFLGGNDDEAAEQAPATEKADPENNDKDNNNNNTADETAGQEEETDQAEDSAQDGGDAENPDEDNGEEAEGDQDIEDDAEVTDGGSAPDVEKTIVNPSWQPVGTSQTGEHTAVYEGVDWNEMVQAITYATGIPESNMTIWFLGNNGPNQSVGTVSTKDQQEKYRVYIEWVDGQGWKPVKMEQLNSIQ